jgi:hypothetical protein
MNSFLAGSWLSDMRTLCTMTADLTGLRGSLRRQAGPSGVYYKVDFEVAVRFGGTQLQATIQWKEGVRAEGSVLVTTHSSIQNKRREGPVTIIPNAII